MAHIRLDKIFNGVITIPLTFDNWMIDKNANPSPSTVIFNDDGTINLIYSILKYRHKHYIDFYNEGYKYIRFDYDYINLVNQPIFCIGSGRWIGNTYSHDWYYQIYQRQGTYTIMNMANKTYITDGAVERAEGYTSLTNLQEITLGMNMTNNIHIRRVALADNIEKLKNLPKNY